MTITNLSIRRGGLYAVTFDNLCECENAEKENENTLLIFRDTFDLSCYKTGSNLSLEQINELNFKSLCDRAYSKGLWYLNYKDYTKKAMYEKLEGQYPEFACEFAVEKLIRLHIIDDMRFATRYAEILIKNKNTPKKQAVYKLVLKGVEKQTAQNVCDDIDIDESAQLKELVEKKYAHRLKTEQEIKKATASLLRKGFSFYNIKSALKEFADFSSDEGED